MTTYYTPAAPTLSQPLVSGTCACGARVAPVPSFYAPPPAPPVDLVVCDNKFALAVVQVAPGTTVRWFNRGRHVHTVTSSAGLFDSADVRPRTGFAYTFTRPGTYMYFDRYDPAQRRGTINVR
jgi:plastocyanin